MRDRTLLFFLFLHFVDVQEVVTPFDMIKKVNGNMLSIYVHADKDTTDNINDPRYLEYADQVDVYLLWQTVA